MALKDITQVVVQKNELGEVIGVLEIKTLPSEKVKELRQIALENRSKEKEKLFDCEQKIDKLLKKIEKIENELAYNRGDISREEYEKLCGSNK